VRRAYLLVLAVVLLAGCGSSGSYASNADAICGKVKRKTDALSRPATLADLAELSDQVLPLLDDARRQLHALRPPAGQKATANAWLAEFDVTIDDVKKIRDKARAGDAAGVRAAATPALRHNERANELAAQLGMKVCSKD
jgi:type VI protein secretion system component VasK